VRVGSELFEAEPMGWAVTETERVQASLAEAGELEQDLESAAEVRFQAPGKLFLGQLPELRRLPISAARVS
jgi:hypothetical protein